jgi:heat-inducible transcriptional repressor
VEISARQSFILRKVIEGHLELDHPVGSKWVATLDDVPWGPSTIRSELARLEEAGLLAHPHTSAGRVPTETGWRHYVDEVLAEGRLPVPRGEIALPAVRREVEDAMRATTEQLSQVTNMLALVSAPQLQTTTVRHVEIVLLNPRTVTAVVITSTGGVAKRNVAFADPVDPGLANWAREYLNERLAGQRLGTNAVKRAFEEPSLSPAERRFLGALAPVFTDVLQPDQRLYLGGTTELLEAPREDELDLYRHVLMTLERRAALLELLGQALDPLRTWVRVGGELDHPALQEAALVGAAYGLTNRALGAVGLLGPVRMDYDKAIRSVRGAAQELSRFVEDVYEDN